MLGRSTRASPPFGLGPPPIALAPLPAAVVLAGWLSGCDAPDSAQGSDHPAGQHRHRRHPREFGDMLGLHHRRARRGSGRHDRPGIHQLVDSRGGGRFRQLLGRTAAGRRGEGLGRGGEIPEAGRPHRGDGPMIGVPSSGSRPHRQRVGRVHIVDLDIGRETVVNADFSYHSDRSIYPGMPISRCRSEKKGATC